MSRVVYLQNGFTLIELIVAVTIMALLSSFGIASFVTYSRTQTLQAATQEFVTTLQLAKASAVSQVKPDTCANTGTLDGYQVIKSTATRYTIGPICGGTRDVAASKTITIPPSMNVQFTSPAQLTLTFHTISGIVSFDPAPGTDYAEFVLEETQSESQKTIRVYSDGRINVL